MVRNDYRRALILLRSNAPDYSGHVRLERRTLMGSMNFVLRTPQDSGRLDAVLVGRSKDAYYACPIGTFRRDARGQAVLGWNFNPRDVCGRELEQYQKIIVARSCGGECQIVLFGNLNGFAEMNWEAVRSAVCLSLQSGPARSSDATAETSREFLDVEALPDEPEAPLPQVEPRVEATPAEEFPASGLFPEPAPAAEILPEAEEAPDLQMEPVQTAAEQLGISADLPWPESVESLRTMFRTQPALADAPDADFTYISAPMPAGSGYSECAVGLRAQNGVLEAVCYALRAPYSTQPPAGMEDYVWSGNGNEGWWKLELNLSEGQNLS